MMWRIFWWLESPCGLSVRKVKKILQENSHAGKYWGVKAKFHFFRGNVTLHMGGNESYDISLVSGKGRRLDLDYDGCSIQNDFDLVVDKNKDGKLTILRVRY